MILSNLPIKWLKLYLKIIPFYIYANKTNWAMIKGKKYRAEMIFFNSKGNAEVFSFINEEGKLDSWYSFNFTKYDVTEE